MSSRTTDASINNNNNDMMKSDIELASNKAKNEDNTTNETAQNDDLEHLEKSNSISDRSNTASYSPAERTDTKIHDHNKQNDLENLKDLEELHTPLNVETNSANQTDTNINIKQKNKPKKKNNINCKQYKIKQKENKKNKSIDKYH
eukprot:461517_1